jgi:hypothetical protein
MITITLTNGQTTDTIVTLIGEGAQIQAVDSPYYVVGPQTITIPTAATVTNSLFRQVLWSPMMTGST